MVFGFWKKKERESDTEVISLPKEKVVKEKKSSSRSTSRSEYTSTENGVKFKVEKEESCSITLSIEVSSDKVLHESASAAQVVQLSAQLPGFRTGKAPLDLVKQNFPGAIRERAVERLLSQSIEEVFTQKGIKPASRPSVDKIDLKEGGPLSFQVLTEKAPTVKLKKYKGIDLNDNIPLVTEEEVLKSLERLAEERGQLVPSEETVVQRSHFIVVDYEGFQDGKVVPNTKAENTIFDLNSPQLPKGLSEGLEGAQVGDTREVTVKQNENEMVLRVTVKGIKKKNIPAIDDEFSKDLGTENLENLKSIMKASLERTRQRTVRHSHERQIDESLLLEHVFSIPDSLVSERTTLLIDRQKKMMLSRGMSEDEWNKNLGVVQEKTQSQAENDVRLSYILSEIGRTEKIDITDEDLENERKLILAENKGSDKNLDKYFKEHEDAIRSSIFERKLYDALIALSKIKEKE